MIKTILTLTTLSLALCAATVTRADIFEWEYIDPADPGLGKRESSMLVPDGAGVDAVPDTFLLAKNLTMAYLIDKDLSNANFVAAILSNADLTGAKVREANFRRTTSVGFTASQLYSTASYLAQDLTGIGLGGNDLSGWDFAGQNLTNAIIGSATLSGADLSQANLTNTDFNRAVMTNADLRQANITSAVFNRAVMTNADFRHANLTSADFFRATLTNADFSQANLSDAYFVVATLIGADFSGAEVRGANFGFTKHRGFVASQLYSTASYKAQDLTGIRLSGNDMSGWDFSGQDLSFANFDSATLIDADLTGAEVRGTDFGDTTSIGFTASQLYSTASYQAKDLAGIELGNNEFFDWDFSGQNLSNANFDSTTLIDADLSRADLRGASGVELTGAIVTNLIRPDGVIDGLDLSGGQMLFVRDYDGKPTNPPIDSLPITVEQHFNMENGGDLQLWFEADAWGSTISFEAGIQVLLGGTLNLDFAADVELASQVGRTLDLFDWTGVVPAGAFTVESPYNWDLSDLYSTGEVTLLAVPEPTSCLLLLFAFLLIIPSVRSHDLQVAKT